MNNSIKYLEQLYDVLILETFDQKTLKITFAISNKERTVSTIVKFNYPFFSYGKVLEACELVNAVNRNKYTS